MYTRELTKKITEALHDNPAVAILGPRQVGKTTLAFEIAKGQAAIYLDLEDPEDRQKLSDPAHYLSLHTDKLVILDEVQRYPDLFMSLRGIIDKGRREGRGNGRFLILGSASNQLLAQSSESLAGRISYLELTGLNPLEIEAPTTQYIQQLWLRGGFPDSYAATNDIKSHNWRKNFITTSLERDIPQLGSKIPSSTLLRFWTMLAHVQGEPFDASKIAASLGVASSTTSRYLDLMVDLLLVQRLKPWSGNINKRLIKSPRTYVRDSGILHSLLQITDYTTLLGHPILGKSWEGFVIENTLSCLPSQVQAFFYRTIAGAEIDLLLEINLGEYWAVEIKASKKPQVKKGFHIACKDLDVKRKFVIYSGEDSFSLGNDIIALSLPNFLQALKQG